MIRRGIEVLNEGGGSRIEERASKRTNDWKDERGNRMKRLKDKGQNARDASQTIVGS